VWKQSVPQPSLQQIVDRARILVIDDQPFPYAPLFRKAGYQLTKWPDVTNLVEIEQGRYDIVLLDLQGVGKKLSQDQGLGVLRHIKDVRPSQVVVAYSNADWPVKYQPFFDQADAVLPKTADFVDFKKSVDDLLQEHFSVGFHLNAIQAELERTGVGDWRTKRAATKSIAKRSPDPLRRALMRRGVDPETMATLIGMAQIAIGVAQIWTN
jgi:hypothetical protein